MSFPSVAVMGATGLVGRTLMRCLHERFFPHTTLVPLGSRKSYGAEVAFGDKDVRVTMLEDVDFRNFQLVFSALPEEAAVQWVPKALEHGAWVIDKSTAYRMATDVPLVVPEINGLQALTAPRRLIASPNCIAGPLALTLAPFQKQCGIKRIVVSTYQSVSGVGKGGMDALMSETKGSFGHRGSEEKRFFGAPIAFNVVPVVGVSDAHNDTSEEKNIRQEVQKILGIEVPVHVTCVRVPVFIGHCFSVTAVLGKACSDPQALLNTAPGVSWVREGLYTTALDATGQTDVLVSRVRQESLHDVSFWAASDNTRKGAALNSVQIAELLLPFWS